MLSSPSGVTVRARSVQWAKRHAVLATVVLGVTYAATAGTGMQLAARTSVTAVFYSAGLALAAVLLLGNAALPGIALGSFLGNVLLFPATSDARTYPIAAIIALGAALQAAVGAALVERFGEASEPFRSPRSVLAFVLLGAVVACTINATIGVGALAAFGALGGGPVGSASVTWWIGDASGVMTATPFLLARLSPPNHDGRTLEGAALSLATLAAGAAVVASGSPLVYLLIPCVVWAALRFGLRGATSASLVVSLFAIFAAMNRKGAFRGFELVDTLLLLQVLVAVTSTM